MGGTVFFGVSMTLHFSRPPGLEGLGKLRLASQSPRRLELLRQVGLEPTVIPPDVDETQRSGESPVAYVERMARTKAAWGAGPEPCLGADTVVTLDGVVFGKPENGMQARHTLKYLAGRSHQVLTAVAVVIGDPPLTRSMVSTTTVWMKNASDQEIDAYVASGESMDKAGAYGIQGLGAFLVARIEGSYTGVVGLPLFETVVLLQWAADPHRASP
ncbi:MAG: maf protein [Magnetococcales bacterium]|nr:maf protein [Magnetococcales bacterium]